MLWNPISRCVAGTQINKSPVVEIKRLHIPFHPSARPPSATPYCSILASTLTAAARTVPTAGCFFFCLSHFLPLPLSGYSYRLLDHHSTITTTHLHHARPQLNRPYSASVHGPRTPKALRVAIDKKILLRGLGLSASENSLTNSRAGSCTVHCLFSSCSLVWPSLAHRSSNQSINQERLPGYFGTGQGKGSHTAKTWLHAPAAPPRQSLDN